MLNDKHKQDRLSFCQEGLTGKIKWDGGVVISDEARFCFFSDNQKM
jgi:hypothetical protein